MTLFALHLDEKPVPQGRARTTRWGTFYPKTSNAYRATLVAAIRESFNGEPLTGPLSVRIALAGARANSDLDNHAKMVLDALQDAGVIASDDVRTLTELTVRVVDGEPSTFIDITETARSGTRTGGDRGASRSRSDESRIAGRHN